MMLCLLSVAAGPARAQDEAAAGSGDVIRGPGRIVAVTLYRSQAMVTREFELEAGQTGQRLIFENLPPQINPDSVFAEGDEQIVVRATQVDRRPVGASPQENIRSKQEQIADLRRQIEENATRQQVMTERLNYLGKLENFVAPAAMAEMTHGVLNAQTLKTLTEFAFGERAAAAEQLLELQQASQKLNEQLALAERELAELSSGGEQTAYEASVFLAREGDVAGAVQLSYLVNGCGWMPSYSLRGGSDQPEATIEYNALISQFSGEDWTQVSLTLSTASPTLSAMRPALAPYRIGLTGAAEQAAGQKEQVAQAYNRSLQSQVLAANEVNNSIDFRGNVKASLSLNYAVEDLVTLELNSDLRTLQAIVAQQPGEAEQPSITYPLPQSVTLTSRRDQQIVRVATESLPASMYLVATPLLTNLVYREAELTNRSSQDFLPGPIAIYLNDQFVGRAEIPLVSRGQKFLVGLGADPRLRSKRELVERTEETQGGNRRVAVRYRLSVENFREEPADVRLLDRLPLAAEGADIQIKLAEDTPPLSEDPIYRELERPEGILRWDLSVPPGGDAAEITYGYTVEFDRQYELAKAADRDDAQEFEQLLLRRQRY